MSELGPTPTEHLAEPTEHLAEAADNAPDLRYRERMVRDDTLEIRRFVKTCLERATKNNDVSWANCAAKWCSERVRLERLEMDYRKERLELEITGELVSAAESVKSMRGPH